MNLTVLALALLLLSRQGAHALSPPEPPESRKTGKTVGFEVTFDSDEGHRPRIRKANLPGTPVVIEYDESTLELRWPAHRSQLRTFWLHNRGTKKINNLYWEAKNEDDGTWIAGPAAAIYRLDPGERLPVSYLFDWKRFFPKDPEERFEKLAGRKIRRAVSVRVFQSQGLNTEKEPRWPDFSEVRIMQRHLIRVDSPPHDAVLTGTVLDGETGKAVKGAQVEATNPSGEIKLPSCTTDDEGTFTMPVPAMTALITVKAEGRRIAYRVADVPAGKKTKAAFTLRRRTHMGDFRLIKRIETGMNLTGWALAPDGARVLLTPGLADIPRDVIAKGAHAWFINPRGSIIWKYFLGEECLGPDLSSDGRLASLPTRAFGADGMKDLRLIAQETGVLAVSFALEPEEGEPVLTVSAFSPNGARLAVGASTGNVWLLDTRNNTVLWERRLHGQVRALRFNPVSHILYASADPGVLAAFAPDGAERWRAYTSSFAFPDNIAVTSDGSRLAVEAKAGGFAVLDREGSEVFRTGFRDGGGHCALAAPDGSYFVSTTGSTNGAHVLSPRGRLLWWTNDTSEGSMMTEDGSLILMGSALYDREGDLVWRDSTVFAPGDRIPVAVITRDRRHIILTSRKGSIFFFEGEIRKTPNH
jgi:outer membrane protein assembly factor BamB